MKYFLIIICLSLVCAGLALEIRDRQNQVLIQELNDLDTKEILLRLELIQKEIDNLNSIYRGTTRKRSKLTVAVGDLPSYKDFSNRNRDGLNQ